VKEHGVSIEFSTTTSRDTLRRSTQSHLVRNVSNFVSANENLSVGKFVTFSSKDKFGGGCGEKGCDEFGRYDHNQNGWFIEICMKVII